MRGQPGHKALAEAAGRRLRMIPTPAPAPKPIAHAHWPEAQLEALEDVAKRYGKVRVDFQLRSFDERPAIHIQWRTNCTKCGRTREAHFLGCKCEEPVYETKLVYHYQPDEERQAILMTRFDSLETLKDWNAEWAER